MGKLVLAIGYVCITKQDDVFVQETKVLARQKVSSSEYRSFGIGEEVRDWHHSSNLSVVFPYEKDLSVRTQGSFLSSIRLMWPYRADLYARKVFGGKDYRQAGKAWYEYGQIPAERFKIPFSITFAEVASHNHFVLDRGEKVFKQTAPVIKLSSSATIEEHYALLGLLNSSTSCFSMKQICHQKQMTGGDGVRIADRSKVPYQFAGTALKKLPIPELFKKIEMHARISHLAARADKLSTEIGSLQAEKLIQRALAENVKIDALCKKADFSKGRLRSQLILIQEELDWLAYYVYGLCDETLLADIDDWTDLKLEAGQRPFEILDGNNQDGFEISRNVPQEWPTGMREVWQKRIKAIKTDKYIRIIEDPHYKRRWIGRQGLFNHSSRSNELHDALKEWLLDHLESQTQNAELQTCAQLADWVRNNSNFQQVAALYTGTDTYDVQSLVSELITTDNIPQMAAARLKPKAMKKFRAWQETWDKQRAEDVIDARQELAEDDPEYLTKKEAEDLKAKTIGDIPLPPKYASADFRKPAYWPLRGKLDVPKERFFSMPGCEKSGDSTLVIGWAGLNHLERAQAIAAWYLDRKENEAWSAEQLKPMLVALDELTPWLKQWHNDVDPEFGERLGDYYESFLLEELRTLNISRDELLIWEPVVTKRSGGRRKKTS